jgi:hypothetical protein
MTKLKPAVKKAWTEALRSGRYTQGRETLRSNYDKFCCLGVLCELATAQGVIPPAVKNDIWGDFSYGDKHFGDLRSGTLPVSVQDWAYEDFDPADRQLSDPMLGDWCASDWNDAHEASFEEIADLIEQHL